MRGGARDASQNITITITAMPDYTNATAAFTDANGVTAYCNTTEPALVTRLQSVKSDSHVAVEWDASGKCTVAKNYTSSSSPRIVREELAEAREVVDEPEPQAVEARAASAARAHDVIARAIDHGRWTEQDRDDLLAAMKDLDRAHADEVLSALFPALNDGRVELTYTGTPL
jgi:hypothetical protein